MLDLNKNPTVVEGEVNPQDSGTQIQANSATCAAPEPLVPSDLAHRLNMVQDLPNDHPGTPNLTLSNSDHARLPPHTSALSEALEALAGISTAVPQHLAMATNTQAGDGAPAGRDVPEWRLSENGRMVEVWWRNGAGGGLPCGNQSQASPCQTIMDLDSPVVSDEESDSTCEPRNSRDNSSSKAPMVDLDTLPDEIPVALQYPWSPVHQEEAPLHTTTFLGSSESLQDSATKPPSMSVEEELRLREVAFHAYFKFETQRCTPTARCRSCLAFCQTRLPKLPSSEEGSGPVEGSQLPEEYPPVLKNVEDGEARQARKKAMHGPKSRSSDYRGVTFYKRTGRWEAHIWHDGAQAYLGASKTKEEAARAYDQAALLLLGPEAFTNFPPESYKMEIAYLYNLSKEQLGLYLRRDSRGFGAQASYPGVTHFKGLYQATYGRKVLGAFTIEEDAARAVHKAAVRDSHEAMASLILDTHHVRNIPSYAAQRFAALYPEAAEDLLLRNQASAITSKRPKVPQRTSLLPKKQRSTRQARKPNEDSTSPPASARAFAALSLPAVAGVAPGNEVNENIDVSPSAVVTTHSWDAYLAPRTRHRNAAGNNPFAAQDLQLLPQQPSSDTSTSPTPQQLRNLLPKFLPAPAARPASSSSCQVPGSTGEPSSAGVIKFRLFNVEIRVEEVQDQGSSGTCNLN